MSGTASMGGRRRLNSPSAATAAVTATTAHRCVTEKLSIRSSSVRELGRSASVFITARLLFELGFQPEGVAGDDSRTTLDARNDLRRGSVAAAQCDRLDLEPGRVGAEDRSAGSDANDRVFRHGDRHRDALDYDDRGHEPPRLPATLGVGEHDAPEGGARIHVEHRPDIPDRARGRNRGPSRGTHLNLLAAMNTS